MKKIAILINVSSMDSCSCSGCLEAFRTRKAAFSRYGEDVELAAFTTSGGDLEKKIAKMKRKGIKIVHLSTCTREKNPDYLRIGERLAKDFTVIGYTHGSEISKHGKPTFQSEQASEN